MQSNLYKPGHLLVLCVLVLSFLAGPWAAHADEVQPTAQALTTPTVELPPTEAPLPPTSEPTVESVPTTLPATQAPPTETFRVIEISTRVATGVPRGGLTPVPTAAEPIPTSPTAEEPGATPPPPATETADPWSEIPTSEPIVTAVGEAATPATEEPTPTETPTFAPTETTTVLPTEATTPEIAGSPTGTPGWVPPGPECNLLESEIAVKLDVPYIHQVLDIGGADGNWACGPTSIAMILAYYGKLDPWQEYMAREAASYVATPTVTVTRQASGTVVIAAPSHTPTMTRTRTPTFTATSTPTASRTRSARPAGTATRKATATTARRSGASFAPYITNSYANEGYTYDSTANDPRGAPVAGLYGTICPTGYADWSLMRFVLAQHGLTSGHISVSWDGVVAALKRGHPVVLGTDLTSVGHILVAIGYTTSGQLIVNDPYGNRFAPGYGGTRGDGLLYPWSCSRVRNALEVVGEYPPPARPGSSGSTILSPNSAASLSTYGGRTYYAGQDREPSTVRVSPQAALPAATPYSAKRNNIATAKTTISAAARPTSKVIPYVEVAAATGGALGSDNQQHTIGWGLFSMLSLAAAAVGVRGFKETRRTVVQAPIVLSAADATYTFVVPEVGEQMTADAADESHTGEVEPAKPERPPLPAAGTPKGPSLLHRASRMPLILRRAMPMALPLLLFSLKLYQASKGQDNSRTR